jgi:DNA-binding NarL/FixJ family response regulator
MSSHARVFIVDDHPLVREWLGNLLRQQSDLVVCGQAEEPPAALAAMLANPPDVAVVDLSLKNGSGLDLVKDLSARLPRVAIVVLSMHEELYYAERALRAGARAYVMKRESTGQIIEAIRQARAGRIFANPEVLARLAARAVGKPAAARGTIEGLSDRELEVFRRLGHGQPTRQIAEELHVSIKTVQAYCARIKEKLGLPDGAQLVREAVRWVETDNTGRNAD